MLEDDVLQICEGVARIYDKIRPPRGRSGWQRFVLVMEQSFARSENDLIPKQISVQRFDRLRSLITRIKQKIKPSLLRVST